MLASRDHKVKRKPNCNWRMPFGALGEASASIELMIDQVEGNAVGVAHVKFLNRGLVTIGDGGTKRQFWNQGSEAGRQACHPDPKHPWQYLAGKRTQL
jgi:hypothetical protein